MKVYVLVGHQREGSYCHAIAQMAVDTIKEINGVDLIVGNEHKLKILDYLDGLEKKESPFC